MRARERADKKTAGKRKVSAARGYAQLLGRVVLEVCWGLAIEGGICSYARVGKDCEPKPSCTVFSICNTRCADPLSNSRPNTAASMSVRLAASLCAPDGYSSEDGEGGQPVGSDAEEGPNGAAVEGASDSEGEEAAAGSDSESGWSELGADEEEADEGDEAEGGDEGSDSEEEAGGSGSDDEEALELASGSEEEALGGGASGSDDDAAGAGTVPLARAICLTVGPAQRYACIRCEGQRGIVQPLAGSNLQSEFSGRGPLD